MYSSVILYMFQCHSLKSSHPLPLLQSPKDCLYICVSFAVSQTGLSHVPAAQLGRSPEPFLRRVHERPADKGLQGWRASPTSRTEARALPALKGFTAAQPTCAPRAAASTRDATRLLYWLINISTFKNTAVMNQMPLSVYISKGRGRWLKEDRNLKSSTERRVFSNTTVQKNQFCGAQLSL